VSACHAPAIRLERAIVDLFGLSPEGLPDTRPWLDHGRWDDDQAAATSYRFLPVEGDALHQIPVGPVHAGIIEPGHFRFTCDGETVVRLEQRLGYVHKGIDLLMTGASPSRGATLAGRVSGDSTVAYAFAFARAVESALGVEPPERAVWLRAVMAELERLANHIGDFGAICNDASFSIMLAHCAVLREKILRAAADCFGHRLMMDRIVPGGVAADLDPAKVLQLRALADELRVAMPRLTKLYDDTPSLQDRTVSTGILRPDLAQRFAPGGFVGRASGRDFDARRDLAYAPYDKLTFAVPVLKEGDVNARVWIRLKEITESLSLLDQLLDGLPDGPIVAELPEGEGEGLAVVEAFRGDVLIWLRIAGGMIARCHMRDASWFQWPLLEAVIEGNIVADFPLCNKSFNCSYSGHDL
jgi:Ni,Fe-hydrogenase III large subunit